MSEVSDGYGGQYEIAGAPVPGTTLKPDEQSEHISFLGSYKPYKTCASSRMNFNGQAFSTLRLVRWISSNVGQRYINQITNLSGFGLLHKSA